LKHHETARSHTRRCSHIRSREICGIVHPIWRSLQNRGRGGSRHRKSHETTRQGKTRYSQDKTRRDKIRQDNHKASTRQDKHETRQGIRHRTNTNRINTINIAIEGDGYIHYVGAALQIRCILFTSSWVKRYKVLCSGY
jgi:hypothetical protein